MIIKFTSNENNIESNNFVQSTMDTYYDEYAKAYAKRFIGQIPISTDNSVIHFTEEHADNLFLIEFYSNDDTLIDSLTDGKLVIINRDLINDYCRIEIKKN